ncbi:ribonuclease E/G [Magnetovibrio sp. PR-2]|uniref:ribonuclease E/G n=1 Tax=Magnetovibrio sp. PR-2 TaxID=3120356 RepID=UPI002FCE6108
MDSLVVRVRPGETRIARVDGDGRLKDFAVYREHIPGEVGDVFWARVKKVVPNLEAAFVDIGAERDGFLGLAEARPQPFMGGEAPRDRISDYVREGEAVMVQVVAAARDDKGAKLTRRVSVSGAYVVLTPNDPGIRVSKRIAGDTERSRLRTMLSSVLAGNEGCVIRSSAMGVREKLVSEDLRLLRGRWAILCDHAKGVTPPALISADVPPALQFLNESGHGNYTKVLVDDGGTCEQIKSELTKLNVMPSGGVEHVTTHFDIFETAAIQDDVAGLLVPRVKLPGGGSLVIEQTAALTTIDVNAGAAKAKASGRGPQDLALATNVEAMREIARQIRLRNIAGLIVVDYIGMRAKDSLGRMVTALKDAMLPDPVGPQVLGTTKGGLLEITRPRRRPPLAQVLAVPCPSCQGSGAVEAPLSVAYRALDQVLADVWADPALIPVLNVPNCVFEVLKQDGQEALTRMEAKLGQPLDVRQDASLSPDAFRIDRD